MILTRENIKAGGTSQCGFSRRQLALLGVHWPPMKGWLSRLVGTRIEDYQYRQFVSLRKIKPKQSTLTLEIKSTRKCSKCLTNTAYMETDWCEQCIWESVRDDPN